ncbi:hypothetical protein DSM104635_01457 [Terricaulis silvestris]|uniref:Uncharacterized protein n=1 Tax=Terricaulis silvestris TaxID=2686094 RepID=A0A6I6MMX3_9CAUL|nr:hypothetical protein DSM104635_01457 [Terricaulis silvestris]
MRLAHLVLPAFSLSPLRGAGSVQPAYAIDTYVCLLPNASERSDSRGE